MLDQGLNLQEVFFLGFAAVAIVCSLLMITRRDAVHSALLLVIAFFQLAGVYVLLQAEFLAALQVLVYTGAILVLFLFVIMLLQLREAPRLHNLHRWQRYLAGPLGVLLAVELVTIIWSGWVMFTGLPAQAPGPATAAQVAAAGAEPRALGEYLYTVFLLPFEVASLILLVAVVGAIVLARRDETPLIDRAVPRVGVSLAQRPFPGSPQAAQREHMPGGEVTAPVLVKGADRVVQAPGLGSTAAGGPPEDRALEETAGRGRK